MGLGDLWLDDRHHRAARQPDAADHARARLRPAHGHGPIMGIGGVDMLIPPSALTVLLGSLAGISIGGLLIGGIVPGLILSAMYVAYILLFLGCFVDQISMTLITLPFFMPLAQRYDVTRSGRVLFLICM
jgi:TRAP-type C4-dicarboxylate transport system permease large subunit